MKKQKYLRSRKRRGRWFHHYRRGNLEISLGVHGLAPDDPRVFAAFCAEHARYETGTSSSSKPKEGTFAKAVDLYKASNGWLMLAAGTRKSRAAILRRYTRAQGERPLSSISPKDIERALYQKGGHGAVNELKALRPVFKHAANLGLVSSNPMDNVEIEKPKTKGFATASAEEIARFQKRWPIGTKERLVFDLALYTGAARVDLARLSHRDIVDNMLSFHRQKSSALAEVPLRKELRAVIHRAPADGSAFLLTSKGKPFTAESLGNFFGEATREAGITARLHGLRKAFCVYWAEQGATTHQIAAMAGHISLSEVERYTRAADRRRIVRLLIEN